MIDQNTEKQSKRTLSYLIGVAIFLIVLMAVTLFLLLNWAQTGLQVKEMREENLTQQSQAPL